LAQRNSDQLIEGPEDEKEAGAFGFGEGAAEAEDYGALILAENLDGIQEVENQNDGNNQKWKTYEAHRLASPAHVGLYSLRGSGDGFRC
jgi:hypothetical protein